MALLDDVIEAHGGLARRKTFEQIQTMAVLAGGLLPLKGLLMVLIDLSEIAFS